MLESINKDAGLKASSFIKKGLQNRCFPMRFAKLLRRPMLKNIYERLLLKHYKAGQRLLQSRTCSVGPLLQYCTTANKKLI